MHQLANNQTIENDSLNVAIDALAKSIARWTDKPDRTMTAISGLSLFRRDEPTQPGSAMYEPSICLTTQGAKRVLLGDDTYVYGDEIVPNSVFPAGRHFISNANTRRCDVDKVTMKMG